MTYGCFELYNLGRSKVPDLQATRLKSSTVLYHVVRTYMYLRSHKVAVASPINLCCVEWQHQSPLFVCQTATEISYHQPRTQAMGALIQK